MKQIESKWISFILYALVATSLFLTWRIMSVPSGSANIQTLAPTQPTTNISNVKNMEEIFAPHRLTFHTQSNSFVASDERIIKHADSFLVESPMGDIAFEATYDKESYDAFILRRDRVELRFPASIPLGMLSRYFDSVPEEMASNSINRILISTAADEPIYLLDDASRNVYTAVRFEESIEPLMRLYSANKDVYVNSNAYSFRDTIKFLPQADVELYRLDYLVEKQPNSFFIGQLFEDTTELRDDSNDVFTIYSDNISELRIHKETGILYYYRNSIDQEELTKFQQIRVSYHSLKFFDTWTQASYFDGYNSETEQVTYRRYLNGLPIFGALDRGLIRMEMTNSGLVELYYPTEIIQTPLEDRQEKIMLPAAQEMITKLAEASIPYSAIEDMRIGYEWISNDESTRIASLVPHWFVKLDGTWDTVDGWINARLRGDASGL